MRRGRLRAWVRRASVCVFVGLLFTGAPLCKQSFAEPATATPVREADAVCAKCHEAIFRNYLDTPMANASGLATERLMTGSYVHQPSGVEYRISSDGDGAHLSFEKAGDPAVRGRERLEYFLGSGHLGLTYLYTKNGYFLESPVAFYPDLKSYAMKPGLETLRRMPGALPVDPSCLRCHMSDVQRSDAGTDNRYSGLPFLHSGVTCESCHGETRRHVISGGTAAVVNPGKLETPKRDSICIACHLEGATYVEHRGRSALDYKPGEDIREYVSYFDYGGSDTTRRAVSEIEQFSTSKCKLASGDRMSCMNCHDPHRVPAAEERVSFYRSKCLACHTGVKFQEQHYAASPDCTSCHMPKTGAQNIAHVAWTDHRIRQHPERQALTLSGLGGERSLVPVLAGTDNSRDLALGYYDLTVKGNANERTRATALLNKAAQATPDDAAVLRALGLLSEWGGDAAKAEELFREALKVDPLSLSGATNLGTLMAKSGELDGAAKLWRDAFARNEDVLELGQNLSTVTCLLGEKNDAIEILQRVLLYNPDVPELRKKLIALEAGTQECPPLKPQSQLQNR